jgi:hypothetical protein
VPTPDWRFTLSADAVNRRIGWVPASPPVDVPLFGRHLVEKVVLVGLVSVIFYRVFPNAAEARNLSVFLIAALTVVVNAGFGAWRRRLGHSRRSVGAQWFVTLLVNYGAMWLFAGLFAGDLGAVTLRDVTLFAVIIALIVVLYDEYTVRRASSRAAFDATAAAPAQAGL